MTKDLGPYLINHYESQIAFHESQAEKSRADLARISLMYSEQLTIIYVEEIENGNS